MTVPYGTAVREIATWPLNGAVTGASAATRPGSTRLTPSGIVGRMPTQQRLRPAYRQAGTPVASRAVWPVGGERGSRGPAVFWSVLVLALSVSATAVLAHVALVTHSGQKLDQSAMDAVYARENTVERLLSILGNVSIGTAALAVTVCVVLAVLRRRYAAAVGALVLVIGANVTTQVLKRSVFDRPDLGHLSLNSLPSGHTTVVTSVVLAGLLVAPHVARTLVAAIGAFATTLTGASTVVAGWHRPSDVLAAYTVCLAWGAAIVLVLALRRPGRFHGATVLQIGLALVGAVAAGVLLVFIGVRPEQGWPGATGAALVLGAVGIASAVTIAVFARLSSVHST